MNKLKTPKCLRKRSLLIAFNLIFICFLKAQTTQVALPNFDTDYLTLQLYLDGKPVSDKIYSVKPNGGYGFVNFSLNSRLLKKLKIRYQYDENCYNKDLMELKIGLIFKKIITEFARCDENGQSDLGCINEIFRQLKLNNNYKEAIDLYENYNRILESSQISEFEKTNTKIALNYLFNCIKYGYPQQGLKVEYYRQKIIKNYLYEIPLSKYIDEYSIPNWSIEGSFSGFTSQVYNFFDYNNKLFYSSSKQSKEFLVKVNRFIGKPKVHWRPNYFTSSFRKGPIAFSSSNDKLDSLDLGIQFNQVDVRFGWLGRLSKHEKSINKFIFGFTSEFGFQSIFRNEFKIQGDSSIGIIGKSTLARSIFSGFRVPISFGFTMGYNKILSRLTLDFGSKVYLNPQSSSYKIKNFFGGTFSLSLPIQSKKLFRYNIYDKKIVW